MATPISSNGPLLAQIVRAGPVGKSGGTISGNGQIVASTGDQYQIRLKSAVITVAISGGESLKSELQPGTSVELRQSGQQLIIRILPHQSDRAVIQDTSTAGTTPVLPANPNTQPSVSAALPLAHAQPEQLKLFANGKEARQWIDAQSPIRGNGTVPATTDPTQPALIRIQRDPKGTSEAILLQGSKATAEIRQLFDTELANPVWKSFSNTTITEILQTRGGIDIERLKALDRALPANATPTPRPPAQTQAMLRQWLTIALDPEIPVEIVANRLPLQSAPQAITAAEQLPPVNNTNRQPEIIDESATTDTQSKTNLIADMFKRLGFNLESSAISDGNDSTQFSPNTLKARLLLLLGTLSPSTGEMPLSATAQSPNTGTSPTSIPDDTALLLAAFRSGITATTESISASIESLQKTLTSAFGTLAGFHQSGIGGDRAQWQPTPAEEELLPAADFALHIQKALGQFVTEKETGFALTERNLEQGPQKGRIALDESLKNLALRAANPEIYQQLRSLLTEESMLPDASSSPQSIVAANLQTQQSASNRATTPAPVSPALAPQPVAAPKSSPPAQHISAPLKTAIDQAFRNQEATVLPKEFEPVKATIDKIRLLIDTMTRNIEALVTKSGNRSDAAAEPGTQGPSPLPRTDQQMRTLLLNQIQRLVQSTSQQVQTLLTDVKETLNSIPSSTMQRIVSGLEQPSNQSVRSPDPILAMPNIAVDSARPPEPQILRQHVEQTLNRLESLQLLAKSAPAADGQQQIIALPMRIDGELTEVRIRLLKHSSPKHKKNRPGTYSVTVNVSPTFLGDVSAQMDYHENKHLRVRMTFESALTRTWFTENKKALTDAIAGLGFTAVSVDVSKPAPPKNSAASAAPDGNSNIDIRI